MQPLIDCHVGTKGEAVRCCRENLKDGAPVSHSQY